MSRKPIEVSSRKTWNVLRFVDCWDTFWFNPRRVSDINFIRVAVAAAASVYALTWLTSLGAWIADDGLLSRSQAEFLIGRGVEGTGSEGRISPLFSYTPSSFAWAYVLSTSVVCAIVSLGVGGRLLAAAAWALLLGLVHRIPMIQGPGDFFITGLFGYLVICPGTRIKRLLGDRPSDNDKASWKCSLAIRLIQCHVFLWFAASLASHFAEPIWWTGTAQWRSIVGFDTLLVGPRLHHECSLLPSIRFSSLGVGEFPGPDLAEVWNRRTECLCFPKLCHR
jgi:hypothetical protein